MVVAFSLNLLREFFRFFSEEKCTADENNKSDGDRNKFQNRRALTDHRPHGDSFLRNKAVAEILNNLGDRVEHDNLGGGERDIGDHSDGVDNRDAVEKSLSNNIPNRGNVAIFNINSAEEEGETERKEIELEDERKDEEPSPARGNAVKKGEENHDDEINGEVDEGGASSGDSDDILRERDLADKVATSNDGLDALISALGEEAPHGRAEEEIDRVVRDGVAEFQKMTKNNIEDCKHQKWAK